MFGSTARVERLPYQLLVVADHHTRLAQHLREQLASGACDAPNSLITPASAQRLAWMHDTNATDCTAMADTVRRALHPDPEDNDMTPPRPTRLSHTEADGPTTNGDPRRYGLIEWDGSYRPTMIVGCCGPAILRDIIAILTGWQAAGAPFGSDHFRQQHPIPDPSEPAEVLADWLDALQHDTTVPYVRLMDPADLVHTGDPLILLSRFDANPCLSHPAGPPKADRVSTCPSPTLAPAGPPALVNGYPVVAAVADTEHTTSWIVICRRTARMPDRTAWYVTWRTWWDGAGWTGEHGDDGPHHRLSWPQAQQSLAHRLDLPAADPGVYLHGEDHTDTWNCPTCRQPITEVYGCRTLGALLTAIAGHRCPPTSDTATPDPQHPCAHP